MVLAPPLAISRPRPFIASACNFFYLRGFILLQTHTLTDDDALDMGDWVFLRSTIFRDSRDVNTAETDE